MEMNIHPRMKIHECHEFTAMVYVQIASMYQTLITEKHGICGTPIKSSGNKNRMTSLRGLDGV